MGVWGRSPQEKCRVPYGRMVSPVRACDARTNAVSVCAVVARAFVGFWLCFGPSSAPPPPPRHVHGHMYSGVVLDAVRPPTPRRGRRDPNMYRRADAPIHISRHDSIHEMAFLTTLQTSATLIYRPIWTNDGSLDSGRRENRGFYSSKPRRTRTGSPIGTQSPGLPVFPPSDYLLTFGMIVAAYRL